VNAVVMCGGRGTRLDAETEKPLYEVAGVAMVDCVLDALTTATRIDGVFAAVSPNTPTTGTHLADRSYVDVVETPGEGYVADLGTALETVGTPAVTVAADLPLLASGPVDEAIRVATRPEETVDSVTVRTPARLKRQLGVSTDEDAAGVWLPTGLNIVGPGDQRTLDTWDARLAVNVNYECDGAVAERLSSGTDAEARGGD
jgi:adenosylcobinamide-phosphate guanylyltransferase